MQRLLVLLGVAALVLALLTAVGYKLINSPSVQVFGEYTSRVDTTEKVVALSFDDGPTCADVDGVLAAMGEVKGTFFVNGRAMDECPDGAVSLVGAGHELGNHTWSHRAMVFVGSETIEAEIVPTDELILKAGGAAESFVRPPYGKKLFAFPWWLSQHGRHTVLWDVTAETWDGKAQSAEQIAKDTVAGVRPGSIVLLHPWNGRTVTQEAIPLVIEALAEDGYSFVTISELLGER